jgi:hypothetical protein
MTATDTALPEIVADHDLLWGAAAIAAFLGLPIRKVYYLIEQNAIPVRKLNKKTIVASRAQLRQHLLAA